MRRSAPTGARDSVYDALEDLLRAFESRDRERPCYAGISIAECKGLQCVRRSGPMTVNELAGALRLDKSTASRIAKSLESKGYVKRRTDPGDRRALRLAATASGRALERRIRRTIIQRQRAALASLPPEVRRALPGALRRLAAAAVRPEEAETVLSK
jgi:MarR family 2-MHQ and catechol resistance regulon transcriptional repressor